MSVKKEASGRRSVQVEVEVPGTPEEVWQAIATGPGVSSWFVPTPADLPHPLPGPALRVNAVRGPRRGNRSGGLGDADRGTGAERRERRSALDRPGGRPGARRRGGAHHPETVLCPSAARQA